MIYRLRFNKRHLPWQRRDLTDNPAYHAFTLLDTEAAARIAWLKVCDFFNELDLFIVGLLGAGLLALLLFVIGVICGYSGHLLRLILWG